MNSTDSLAKFRNPLISLGKIRLDEMLGYAVFASMLASLVFPLFRYLNYIFPILALLIILGNRSMYVPEMARSYLVVVVAGLILIPFANGEGIKDIYLILTGLSMAFVGFRKLWSWRVIFIASVLGLVLSFLAQGASSWSSVISNFTIDIAASSSTFESGFSYIFGMMAVWAAYTRRWGRFALAFFFAVLTLKRIVILGILFCIIVLFLPRTVMLRLLSPIPMVIANVGILLLLLSYGSGTFDLIIHELTNQSANELGMGRKALYSFIVSDFLKDPWGFLVIGNGPGEAYEIMKGGWSWMRKENLHGDTLKILYEYGGLVLGLFIWALYSSRQPGVLIIALYSNVLLLTDNTLIYPFYIYFATLIAACIVSSHDTEHTGGISR